MLKEFKEFALKGNVIDMGVGIIIGAAFGKSCLFVADILMPPLGLLMGRVDFSSLFFSLSKKQYESLAAAKPPAPPPSIMAYSSTTSSTSYWWLWPCSFLIRR